ncbi:MAG: type II secretion system minor pseudopilin GspI [Gammaproteobacteria bacterium]|nr:MAG: type II secretion system minor pseudopilin GspI [Gammaproteobacteria bacterium]
MSTGHKGFTLIEVLVALAVVAIAFAATMRSMAQSIDTTMVLRDKSYALWIAQNRLALHELGQDWPSLDTRDGTATMAGREWRWQEKVISTPLENLRRIEIEITAIESDYVLARLIGFLRKPSAKSPS